MPLPPRIAAALRGALASSRLWQTDTRAVAAVEFALIIPVLIIILFGMTEAQTGVAMHNKLQRLSRAIIDLVSRVTSVSTSDMASIFGASTAIMQPYDTTGLKMTLSQIKVTQSGSTFTGTVDWSCAKGTGATARPKNSAYTVPTAYQAANTYFLVAETTIPYRPLLQWTTKGSLLLSETTPWPVRNANGSGVDQVTGPSSCPS